VSNNVVMDFHEAAFPINTPHADQQPSQYNQIVNNTMINGGRRTPDAAAIEIDGKSAFNRIAGNIILDHDGHGIIVSDAGLGGSCIGYELVGNSIYRAAQLGIVVIGAKDTELRSNKVFEASRSSPGTYAGIGLYSNGTFGTQLCYGTKIIGNSSQGGSQRCGFVIDSTAPLPDKTVVMGNVFGVGTTPPGQAYELNNAQVQFIDDPSL
jgi:hypothetical protein